MYFAPNNIRIKGETRPDDLEDFFQLIYLYQTKVNKDPKAFASWKARQEAFLGNLGNMPQFKFMLAFDKFIHQNDPRYIPGLPDKELLNQQDYDLSYEKFTKHFGGANDFNYYFVGNFDEQKLRDYIQTYIGAIPNNHIKGAYKKYDDNSLKGIHEFVYKTGKDPKSTVSIVYHGDAKDSDKDKLHIKALAKY